MKRGSGIFSDFLNSSSQVRLPLIRAYISEHDTDEKHGWINWSSGQEISNKYFRGTPQILVRSTIYLIILPKFSRKIIICILLDQLNIYMIPFPISPFIQSHFFYLSHSSLDLMLNN